MTMKIKEFKGSLKPIFNEDVHNAIEEDTHVRLEKKVANDSLPIDQIKARDNQPRKKFEESALDELAQSIKFHGVIQPIIVQATDYGLYEIIAGERRWRAAKRAGLDKIPVIIREYNKTDSLAVALIENIQRENLNPLEEAQAIQNLLDGCAMTHTQVAENIGKSRSTVSNLLRLLELSEPVKLMINSGLLEMGHARALFMLDLEQQIETAKLVVGNNLSVRETEKLVQRINSPQEMKRNKVNPVFEKKASLWKDYLSRKLSSKVDVHVGYEGKGKVVINFDSIEEADWLMNHIGFTAIEEV